jgi:tRNA pseudouridine55 synthase
VTEEHPVPPLDEPQVEALLKTFIGDQYQTPPMFSAKKREGVPLYKLARKGQVVEREPRFIRVSSFELDEWRAPNEIDFTVSCSKGTYVRTLAHDLGTKIGCGAHLTALRRTDIERFKIEDSIPLDEFEELTPPEIQREIIPSYRAVPSSLLK